jgi:parallel beta-helix repeat protein
MRRLVLSFLLLLVSLTGAHALKPWPLPAPINPTCKGTAIAVGNSISAALSGGSTNQTFCLATGTYTVGVNNVVFKSGQTVQGVSPESTIISGGNTNSSFITDGGGANGNLKSLTLANYTSQCVHGADVTGWTYINVNMTNCGDGGAIYIAGPAKLIGGRIHDNAHNGPRITDNSTGAVEIRGVEIDHNNVACTNDGDAAGSKNTNSGAFPTWFFNNYFHDNCFENLWFDIRFNQVEVAGNKIVNNNGEGIMYEISGDENQTGSGAGACLIHDNVIADNNGAGIYISNSAYCEIYNNYIRTPTVSTDHYVSGAVVITNDIRNNPGDISLAGCTTVTVGCIVSNISVHDNTIIMQTVLHGNTPCVNGTGTGNGFCWKGNGYGFDGGGSHPTLASVAWTHNTYYVPSSGCTSTNWFTWDNIALTFAQWKNANAGMDATGSCNETAPPGLPW